MTTYSHDGAYDEARKALMNAYTAIANRQHISNNELEKIAIREIIIEMHAVYCDLERYKAKAYNDIINGDD